MDNILSAPDIPGTTLLPLSGKNIFASPQPAGRRITAGFSYLQRIGKSASIDVWFPEALRRTLNRLIEEKKEIGPEHFPAAWAAVRQFELLQEAGNYKIYDLDATHLTRTLVDLTRNMRAGGYRVTVATLGSYSNDGARDDLEILDRRLQTRLSQLIHMLYLEEQSVNINEGHSEALAAGQWDYRTALPHIGVTLGARDLFRPVDGGMRPQRKNIFITPGPCKIAGWTCDLGVTDAATGEVFTAVKTAPKTGQYSASQGAYIFASADNGREVTVSFMGSGGGTAGKLSDSERKHKLARRFFDILSLLPQNHIVHDTAVGLQLPESINENEWIYLAQGEDTLRAFNGLLSDLFSPFDKVSLSGLNERADAGPEIKATVQHMRGYGDRLTPEADRFYQNLGQLAL
jgi:hypothetical protein